MVGPRPLGNNLATVESRAVPLGAASRQASVGHPMETKTAQNFKMAGGIDFPNGVKTWPGTKPFL
jgi:hypothetical protein